MKKILFTALTSVILVFSWSCGRNRAEEAGKVSHSEIEAAHLAGREAARVFVSKKWKDTLQLQEQLIEANANGAKYDSITRLRAAYDSAFISTVRTVRPEIAAELEKYRRQGVR